MKYFLLCSVIFYFSCNNNIDSNNQVNKTPIKKENNFVDNNLGNDDELDPSRYISKGKEHAEKANQTIKNVKDKMLKGALLDTAVNNLDKAANNLNIASKLDSSNGNTHYLLAKTYFHLMRVKSKDKKDSRSHAILAEEYFEKAILHNCDSTYFALQRLAVVKKDLDKKEESVEILKKCLSLEAPSKLDEQRLNLSDQIKKDLPIPINMAKPLISEKDIKLSGKTILPSVSNLISNESAIIIRKIKASFDMASNSSIASTY